MQKWLKDDALAHIQNLIDTIPEIKRSGRKSSEHVRWVSNSLRFLEDVFGEKSLYYASFSRLPWREVGNIIISDPRDYEAEVDSRHALAFLNQMDQAKGFLLSAKDQLNIDFTDKANSSASSSASNVITILKLGETKLRKLVRSVPKAEKEIQDAYENLLIGADIQYSREHPHIEFSTKKYIPDFSFAEFDLVVELKLCKEEPKLLIKELNDDIVAYKTRFTTIIFLVYDLGCIRDVDLFRGSFEKQENVFVQIVKH